MTVNRGPGVRQIGAIGTTPKEHRLALAGQYAENSPGVPRSGLLVQAATNVVTPTAATAPMTYLVAEVAAVIGRTVGEGVYTPSTTGATIANRTVPTANAPATGSRWDLVWIKQNDQEKGDANNDAILGVTSGTATASPSKPTGTVPAGALILSEHQIFSGAATTTASPNTTKQLWRHTAARGSPIPVRNTAERDEITVPATNQRITRMDQAGWSSQIWNGTAWVLPGEVSLVIPGPQSVVGNIAGVAAGIASGEIRPIIHTGSFVTTTDPSGYFSYDYPVPFPNGVMSVSFTNGDASVARDLIITKASAPFANTVSRVFGSVVKGNGTWFTNSTVRIDFVIIGW